MIRLARTHDYAAVRAILTHRHVYPHIGDDAAPPRTHFRVNEDPRIWYVVATQDGTPFGVFAFFPESAVCWEVHVSMLPAYRTRRRDPGPSPAADAGRSIVPWIWLHTTCCRIWAHVPRCNPLAIRYGQRYMGMQPFGINEHSFEKYGQLHDQVLLGVSRPCQVS